MAIDVLCDRHDLNRAEFLRQATRAGVALPTVDQGTFADWCKAANTDLKQDPPTPGQSGNLLPGTAKDKCPRTVITLPAGGRTDEIRASVIHQAKGEQADAVLVVIPTTTATAIFIVLNAITHYLGTTDGDPGFSIFVGALAVPFLYPNVRLPLGYSLLAVLFSMSAAHVASH